MRRNLVLVASLLVVCACGGDKKKAEGPATDRSTTQAYDDPAATMVPQEDMDAIRRLFERRVNVVARCFVRGVEAGELESSAKGFVTVAVTIQPSGKATNGRIMESNIESRALHSCVLEYVTSWTFPEVPRPYTTSHIYNFQEF
jgi:hypothetical protein